MNKLFYIICCFCLFAVGSVQAQVVELYDQSGNTQLEFVPVNEKFTIIIRDVPDEWNEVSTNGNSANTVNAAAFYEVIPSNPTVSGVIWTWDNIVYTEIAGGNDEITIMGAYVDRFEEGQASSELFDPLITIETTPPPTPKMEASTSGQVQVLFEFEGGPLPVELVFFKAEHQADNVLLSWATASEVNNDYFIVERSGDGLNFERIDLVEGAGYSTEYLGYQYLDRLASFQTEGNHAYYRLKQVDYDGTYEYSNVVYVQVDKKHPKDVRVISTFDMVQLEFLLEEADLGENMQVTLCNSGGDIIMTQDVDPVLGYNRVRLDATHASGGVYVVYLRKGKWQEAIKIFRPRD